MSRSGIMLCYPFEESRLLKWNPPFIVQPKLDGERCRAIFDGPSNMGYRLVSSEGNEFHSVPHINSALNRLHYSTDIEKELDGELYCHGMPFNEIHARVGRTANLHPDYESINFHIFDVVTEDPQFSRLSWLLQRTVYFTSPLSIVPMEICYNLEEVLGAYDLFISKGYEGIVIRHATAPYIRKRSTGMMKFKPKKSDWYYVTGYKEEVDKDGNPKGSLGALTLISDDGSEFSVGSGLTGEQRSIYWANRDSLAGSICHVQYQHTLKNVPRFPVFIELQKGDL